MAMLSSSLSISNNKSTCVIGRDSLTPRLVCKNSSPPEIKTNKLLLRRFSGNTEGIPYFTTLSTTAGSNNWPITQHNDYISLPFSKTSRYLVEVVGSCDGLLCLSDGNEEGLAALWNPSTDDYKILPGSSVQPPPSAAYSTFPSCGFGFDPKSQDYKMVRFVSFTFETEDGSYDHDEDHVEVYSLKTDSWREVNSHNLKGICFFTSTTIDGRCYWLSQSDCARILCFDFSTEQFFPPIPLPDAIKRNDWLEILEFDGSLALLNCNISKRGEYNIWVLKDRSWSHVSVIRHSSSLRRPMPIGFVGNDKLFFDGEDSQLLVYDCIAREMTSLGIYDEEDVLSIVPYSADNCSAPLLNGKSAAAAAAH